MADAVDIIARDHSINWMWYHWLTVKGNTVYVTKSDRYHRFNASQGANAHPAATHTCNFYRLEPLDDRWSERLRRESAERHAATRKQWGFSDDVVEIIELIHDETKAHAMYAVHRS